MACMRVTVVGCAGSFPGPDSPASCYLLEAEGFRLVIDLGNGALGALQRYAGLFSIDAICLSHLHADHCIDLAAYWVARQYAPDGSRPPIPVYGPRGTAGRVTPDLGPGAEIPDGPPRFGFHDLEPGTTEIGPFRLIVDRMNHPVETFGFRVEHAGWRLAYSADTGESEALVRLAAGAARAGVGQLVLTHLVPWNDRDRTLAEADGIYTGPLSLATSGLVLGPAASPPAGR